MQSGPVGVHAYCAPSTEQQSIFQCAAGQLCPAAAAAKPSHLGNDMAQRLHEQPVKVHRVLHRVVLQETFRIRSRQQAATRAGRQLRVWSPN